jgi:Tfp pilus assembly protein PilV
MRLLLNKLKRSVTLLELLIAIALISLIVIGFSGIELFSRYHLLTSDRRIKTQNEVSFVLEHMSKQISRAIGNERVNNASNVTRNILIGGDAALWAYIDASGDGQRDAADNWIAYIFNNASHELRYCEECNAAAPNQCNSCNPSWETISRHITNLTVSIPRAGGFLSDNYVDVEIRACYNPSGIPDLCGSTDNPSVTMRNHIKMPSVSTN